MFTSWIAPQHPLSEWTLMSAVNVAHSINSTAIGLPLDYSTPWTFSLRCGLFSFLPPWYEMDGLLPGFFLWTQTTTWIDTPWIET